MFSFYYGRFEYGGIWYDGKHEPLITQELFDRVQERLKRDHLVRSEIKEFAFTKLITCGHCQSGITAEEKYKKLKDGTTVRYLYYGCTRSKDHKCKGGYIREEELIEQIIGTIDQMEISEIGMKHKFEEELERMNKFQKMFTDSNPTKKIKSMKMDFKDYAKYLLKEGSTIEKRELLSCLKSKLVMREKIITLQK